MLYKGRKSLLHYGLYSGAPGAPIKYLILLYTLDMIFFFFFIFYFSFDDTNTENLRRVTKSLKENEELNFDPTSIDWTNYMMNTHIPSILKYAMK